jgi:hypothetical protein
LKEFYKLSKSSNSDRAMCKLFIYAFFFAMRSYKCIKVCGHRKTKLLTLANIRFFSNNRLVQHNDKHLHLSECVYITFEFQKCDTKHETITQHKSGDLLLCPVRIWASIICRISSYPLSNMSTTVNTYMKPDKSIHYFSGTELLRRPRLATTSIGSDILGFSAKEIGLHSARSGAAMAMYLAGVPVFTIMLLGRWSSDAFLCYIRKQVKEFSRGISAKMIINKNFFTIPKSSSKDPRVPNHSLNPSCQPNNGLSFRETIRPLASVFY